MGPCAAEPVAPGEEQVVFSRTAGVVASKVSYMDVIDPANDWQVLENPVSSTEIQKDFLPKLVEVGEAQ